MGVHTTGMHNIPKDGMHHVRRNFIPKRYLAINQLQCTIIATIAITYIANSTHSYSCKTINTCMATI